MRVTRLFVNSPLDTDSDTELDNEHAHYLRSVLKLSVGDPVALFDGKGGEYRGAIRLLEKKRAVVHLQEFNAIERESPLSIHLGVGVSRGDRMDFSLQKATELGVSAITPILTQRCEVKLPGARGIKKVLHWQKVVNSACQQSHRTRIPHVAQITELSSWLLTNREGMKLVLDNNSNTGFRAIDKKDGPIIVLVGPEGGLEKSEIGAAKLAGFESLNLGPRILRTETAPLVAISILQSLWGDIQ
mgnify:CR=1 FL=1